MMMLGFSVLIVLLFSVASVYIFIPILDALGAHATRSLKKKKNDKKEEVIKQKPLDEHSIMYVSSSDIEKAFQHQWDTSYWKEGNHIYEACKIKAKENKKDYEELVLEKEKIKQSKEKIEGERKQSKEAYEQALKAYKPAIGDVLTWELVRNGVKYKCVVKEIRPDGWLIDEGDGASYHPKHSFLLEVYRKNSNGKIIKPYQW